MTKKLDVSKGDNWTVLVFWCSFEIIDQVLIDFFDAFSNNPIFQLPHYTVRGKNSEAEIIVSLRVLRKPEESETVKAQLLEIITKQNLGNSYQIDIPVPTHKWIPHGTTNENWDEDQCTILSELSNLSISLMKKNLFHLVKKNCAREHAIHLFSNMMGLIELNRLYYDLLSSTSPPTILNANVRYVKEDQV